MMNRFGNFVKLFNAVRTYILTSKVATLALLIILIASVSALIAPYLIPYNPNKTDLTHSFEAPSLNHPFGTDELGRDIMVRMVYGARVSLAVGASVVAASVIIGLVLGAISGYAGGIADTITMRLVDIFLSFPGIILAVGLVAIIGPGLLNVVVALIAANWPGYTRVVRSETLRVKNNIYVIASRMMGGSKIWVIRKHIIPSVLPSLTVLGTIGFGWAVLAEAGISFLGLGIQPPEPSWGNMVSEGFQYVLSDPLILLFPGMAIALTVWSFNMIGDHLRDLTDPYLKQ
jgi:peptide/nickel transport system permease protein